MKPPKNRILVVDDDMRLRDLLLRYLNEQGFTVDAAHDAASMDRMLAAKSY
jgi:two-component system phosphate regulon response regulator OmpR